MSKPPKLEAEEKAKDRNDHGQYQKARFVTIDANHSGQRIDNFLLGEIKEAPRSYIYRILRKGEVRVNKKRAKPVLKLKDGDIVRIPPIFLEEKTEKPKAPEALLKAIKDSIILEDDDLILINKPSGLAVHGGTGQKYGLIESFRQLRPDMPFVELVHRLDKETSGIVMLAKSRGVLLELHEMLKDKKINKYYQTLALGKWQGGVQHIKNNLQRQQGRQQKVKVVEDSENSKHSESIFYPIHCYKQDSKFYSLLEVELLTGRMHQIRTQLADRGSPVIGDSQYGDFAENREVKKRFGLKRLFLHAFHLQFTLLSSGKTYDCQIPL
ncbi:UNVERIFIED_CONTAM: hypothetical protein GTU68_008200, partial [Idotea baltica]|nr:hypothetical protein [Idotea baltica]